MHNTKTRKLFNFIPKRRHEYKITSGISFIIFLIIVAVMCGVLVNLHLNAYNELYRKSEVDLAKQEAWRLYALLLSAEDDEDRMLEYMDEYTREYTVTVFADNTTGNTLAVNHYGLFIDEGALTSSEYADGYALIEGRGFSYYAFYATTGQNAPALYYCVDSAVIDKHITGSAFKMTIILFSIIGITLILAYYLNVYCPTQSLWITISNLSEGNFDFDVNSERRYMKLPGFSAEINIIVLKLKQIISQEYYSQLLKKRAELNALQREINPHFLYNTIDCIRGQALSEKSYGIANIAKAMSAVFRYSIDGRDDFASIEKELAHVKNYMTIQNYRFNNRFELDIEIEKENRDEIMGFCVPRMIIQPLVENAIIHGLEHLSTHGRITIRITMTQARLIIMVEDNGVGIKQEKLKELNDYFSKKTNMKELLGSSTDSGIALINVHDRIRIIYGDDYGVKIYSTYGIGTQCMLQLGHHNHR